MERDMGTTLATKQDLLQLATREDLLATKRDLLLLATKEDHLLLKQDVALLRQEMFGIRTELRQETVGRFALLDQKIDTLELRLTDQARLDDFRRLRRDDRSATPLALNRRLRRIAAAACRNRTPPVRQYGERGGLS